MIEEDSCLSIEQKNKIKHLTDYFYDKNLSVEEIQNYRKKYMF